MCLRAKDAGSLDAPFERTAGWEAFVIALLRFLVIKASPD
jgi:hypothetical protein